MERNIWEEFDEKIDVEGLKKDIAEAAENSGDFKEVPHGKYEVEITKMELKKSKKGDPMLSIWFKIIAGEYKGSLIFYNQMLTTGFGIHNANEFLRSLDSGVEVEFINYKQYHEMLLDIFEEINGKLEYGLDYKANTKNPNFNVYEIFDVYEK